MAEVGLVAMVLVVSVGVVCVCVAARVVGIVMNSGSKCAFMVVLGSGGHTAEMLTLVRSLPRAVVEREGRIHSGGGDTDAGGGAGDGLSGSGIECTYPRCYVVASTDALSAEKALRVEAEAAAGAEHVERIPRSREVGQSYFTSTLTTVRATLAAIPILLKHAPKVLLVNGPGTCLPLCAIACALRLLRISHTHVVYVESAARVESLSLTGQLLRDLRLADKLLVQWPELADPRRKVTFVGRLV